MKPIIDSNRPSIPTGEDRTAPDAGSFIRRDGRPYPTKIQPKGSIVQTGNGYLTLKVPGHLLAPPSGYVAVHRLVLAKAIGLFPTICFHCWRTVDWFERGQWRLVVDHLDGDPMNNERSNLVPSCSGCNTNRTKNPHVVEKNIEANEAGWWPGADDECLR